MPITKAEAQEVTRAFVRDYPGALELAYKFREDAAELYGPRAAEVPQDMKGGYVPKETQHAGRAYRGRVDVPLANVEDAGDLLLTLRHEVLGHYGANTFAPAEKRALLDGLVAAREEPSLKPLWDDIDRRYAGYPVDVRAEEVFALYCEGIEPSHHQGADLFAQGTDQVRQKGQQSFAETCIARVRPMQADDLHNIVCVVAQGLHDRSRTQQTFPQINELFRRDDKMEPKKPFHETVAEKLIQQLKEGTAPWQKPWEPGQPAAFIPMNPTTGKRYRGINAIQLMSQGHSDQRWMTYKQAAAVGAQVRKGEKGTPIQYWKFSDEQIKTDADGKPVLDAQGEPVKQSVKLERPRVFFATVFNAEQIDGLPPLQPRKQQDWTAVERAEHILQASGAVIRHGEQNRAFYRPATDSIHMPDKGQFPTADNYYATALHELGHWTGHESRLDRDLSNPFGSEGYAKEELRAEIASMILGDELGIGHDPGQHVAYVGSWIKALQDDPLEIFRAAADAEKIQDYVLGLEQQQVQEQDQQQRQALPETQAESVVAALESAGWVRSDGAAIASKSFDTVNGKNDAHAFITAGDGINRTLQFQYLSEGRNVAAADGALIPVGATAEQAARIATAAAARADKSIQDSYGVRVAAMLDEGKQQEANMQAQQAKRAEAAYIERVLEAVTRVSDPAALQTSEKFELAERRNAIILTADARTISPASFQQSAKEGFGVDMPADWNGRIQVQGNVTQQIDGKPHVAAAHSLGVEPEFFGVYAQHEDGTHQWLADFPSVTEADELADQLRMVDAITEQNPHEQAAKLARVLENAVRRDPNSTDEQISAAKEARKDAEGAAMLNDADMQRRIAEFERERGQQQAAAPAAQSPSQIKAEAQAQKTFIQVPYREKDEAKALGAKWDRQEQSWYVPAGVAAGPFAKWAQGAATAAVDAPQAVQTTEGPTVGRKAAQEREYLAVPYGERIAAKAAGAEWDKVAKSWYAGPKADMEKLARWKPENVPDQQGPAMTPQEEFADALRSIGCVVSGEHPIMDGKKHRISVEGEKPSEKAGSGFYVGHLDGHPAGYMKNNKTGIDMKWKSKGYTLDPEEKARMAAEAATKLQAREAEQAQAHEATAQRVGRQMADLVPVEQPTPYMQAKGIEPQAGVFTDRAGQKTYIPATDVDGKQWTMQYIQEDGTKRFAKDSRKEGCFHVVGGMDALAQAPALVIGEGYATAGSLSQSLGFATVAAFDSGNLPAVAKALHEKFPDKPVIIAGDDDRHLELTQGVNPGKAKAQEAAKITGGKAMLPIFAPGENSYPAGLPPVTPEKFREHQRTGTALTDQQLAALDHMKGKTDFNDLANKSVLGKEGIDRQVRAAVHDVIEKHQARIEQQQQRVQRQDQPLQPRRAAKI